MVKGSTLAILVGLTMAVIASAAAVYGHMVERSITERAYGVGDSVMMKFQLTNALQIPIAKTNSTVNIPQGNTIEFHGFSLGSDMDIYKTSPQVELHNLVVWTGIWWEEGKQWVYQRTSLHDTDTDNLLGTVIRLGTADPAYGVSPAITGTVDMTTRDPNNSVKAGNVSEQTPAKMTTTISWWPNVSIPTAQLSPSTQSGAVFRYVRVSDYDHYQAPS